ncbi:sucrase ferredoxin [Phycicoccus ginsengisoli]
MLGTAAPATRWLLVEHPGGWLPAAFDSPGLPSGLGAAVHRTALAVGGRAVLVRRPGRGPRDAPREWAVIDSDGRQEWGTWTRAGGLEAAVRALRDGPASAEGPAAGDRHHEDRPAGDRPAGDRPDEDRSPADRPAGDRGPQLLVCTHGRHDVCCAVRGRPVAAAVAERWPERTWECSHIGGDRFAANLLVVPDGTTYGGLDPDSAVAVVERHLAGRVDPDHLRGFATVPPPVQAALAAVLRDHGPGGPRDVRAGAVTATGPGMWEVEVLGVAGMPGRTVVDVRRSVQAAARLTCRAAGEATAHTYAATTRPR